MSTVKKGDWEAQSQAQLAKDRLGNSLYKAIIEGTLEGLLPEAEVSSEVREVHRRFTDVRVKFPDGSCLSWELEIN